MAKSERTEQNIYDLVGKNIKKYRQLKGLTQASLADAVLLSDNFIGKLESRTPQTISIDTLYQIAKALDVDIRNMFDGIELINKN